MGKYFWTTDGIERDDLHAGGVIPVDVWNINVGGESAVIERGMLMCADTPTGEFTQVTSAGGASKVLVIARDDFTVDATHKVTQAYSSGTFHAEKIKLGGESLTIEPFVEALRKENIHLRHLKPLFGDEQY